MDQLARSKWDNAAGRYDLFARGAEKRWTSYKLDFYGSMQGEILFVAVGTGLDIQFFPPGRQVTAIDISPKMLEKARPRAEAYDGHIELQEMDAEQLTFADDSFDQVFTACTFCSVPDPVRGLRELHRVLKPGGELHMFEHTASRWFPFSLLLRVMNPISRRSGPELIRNTPANAVKAGFHIRRVQNLYLDVLKTIFAVKEGG